MKQKGTVRKWNDEKGFGFIRSGSDNQEFFFHIKSFKNHGKRPETGMRVRFEAGVDNQGRKQAVKVRSYEGNEAHPTIIAFFLAAAFLFTVVLLSIFGYLPKVIVWLYMATSLLSFLLYSLDKSAARKDQRRTPEATFHQLALIGGWPGALFAQQLLRHKSKKKSFRNMFKMTVILNVLMLIYLLSPYGAWFVNKINGLAA